MRNLIIALALLLAGCLDGPWGDVPEGEVNPVGREGWRETVTEAAGLWADALAPHGCPPPFIVTDAGHRIELVSEDDWVHGERYAGMENHIDEWIEVRDFKPEESTDAVLQFVIHEMGHALGLEHDDGPGQSVMESIPFYRKVFPVDAERAAANLNCGDTP